MKQRFFYTTDTPHEWSSGKDINYWGENGELKSLEEAKTEALKARRGKPGYSGYVSTTWGVEFSEN